MYNKKYNFNENYFEKIDTEEKAYWLGFIAADGSINLGYGKQKFYQLHINLKGGDYSHLEKFQKAIERNAILKKVESNFKTPVVRLYVCSKKMIGDLLQLGIVPRKSKIKDFKPWVGKKYLMPHYWRGYFDGDGSIGKYLMRNSFYSWKISLNANLFFCEAFRDFLICNGCVSDGYLEKHASIYKICWGGIRPTKSIAKILYTGGISLDRKEKLAKELISFVSSSGIK